ncbi:hypothetical protein OIE66_36705 [Nonomuraea sp. NBC_01738]|uniref:hypothetical protein n=1 Tax=Nonomuraea sp. NBC_01738 TaxID=2976003 RepID=UPI002E0E8114|nr:hypothetical protein OIE66_36705 [Nonomuraea sp. NBC_01738]
MNTVRDLRWTVGCALPLVIGTVCATFGTMAEIRAVLRAQAACVGEVGVSEAFGALGWAASRLVLFPAVSVGSALVAFVFPLLGRLPWPAGRRYVDLAVWGLSAATAVAGPWVFTVYDLGAFGRAGCA